MQGHHDDMRHLEFHPSCYNQIPAKLPSQNIPRVLCKNTLRSTAILAFNCYVKLTYFINNSLVIKYYDMLDVIGQLRLINIYVIMYRVNLN